VSIKSVKYEEYVGARGSVNSTAPLFDGTVSCIGKQSPASALATQKRVFRMTKAPKSVLDKEECCIVILIYIREKLTIPKGPER